eukprot:COSAG06_NODE_3509_length_5256_cov_6.771379_4_plen_234_part_00
MFEPRDLRSIQSPTNSKKKYDPTKTGKFGVGFNSVYHLTDVVTFLSGRYLNVLDPHEKYCCLDRESGVQFDLTAMDTEEAADGEPPRVKNLDEIQHTLDGFLPGYEWCPAHVPTSSGWPDKEASFVLNPKALDKREDGMLLDDEGGALGYPGTIMRLPLRTPELAEESEIKKGKAFTEETMQEIFRSFRDEVVELLIFLRHVENIRLLEWHDGEAQPREVSNGLACHHHRKAR